MKVRLTIELNLPNEMTIHEANQEVFDGFVNFAICRHIQSRVDALCEKPISSDGVDYQRIRADYHKEWSKIIRDGERNMKLERV